MTTYIHKNVEVKLTGRKAKKKPKRSRSSGDIVLYEVKPLDDKIDWNDWVDMSDLFKVEEDDNV